MNPQTKNRLLALGALVVAGGALAYVALGNLGQNLVYYWTPGEMLAKGDEAYGATIRLGGIVKPGTVDWSPEATLLKFEAADSHKEGAPAVKVVAHEAPPQMFRDGIGVVVEGTFDQSGVFTSNRLLVKHSNEYKAPAEGEKPGDWKGTVSAASPEEPAK
jgi:cytochrome c-type biogenesis protein CcmE